MTIPVIKDGKVKLRGQINERNDSSTGGLRVRYIRETLAGSDQNNGNHLVEIRAFDKGGTNRAAGRSVKGLDGVDLGTLPTDGSTVSTPYTSLSGLGYILDLGDNYELDNIHIWHYWADSRTYKDVKLSVSADGIKYYTIFDGTVQGNYAESAAGKKHLVTLGLVQRYHFDSVEKPSGVTATGNGFTLEGYQHDLARSNMISTTPLKYTNHLLDISITKLEETYNGYPIFRWRAKPTTEKQLESLNTLLHSQGVTSGSYDFPNGTPYAYSIIWRKISHDDITVGGIASNIGGWRDDRPITDLGDGWKMSETYRTGDTITARDGVFVSVMCPSAVMNEYVVVDLCCFQLEKGAYTGSYTPASSVATTMTVPVNLKAPFTVNVFHRANSVLSSVIDQPSSPVILQLNDYFTNPSITYWNFIKALKGYLKGDTGANWVIDSALRPLVSTEWDKKEHMYTIVAYDKRNFGFFFDGVKISHQTTTVDLTSFTHILFHHLNHNNNSATYRDLSIYNYDLSDEHILSLNGTSFDNRGDIVLDEFDERPAIPEDALYFPLSSDTYDEHKNIKAVSESGAFVDSSAWAGIGTRNEFINGDFKNSSNNWSLWGDTGHAGTGGVSKDPANIYSEGHTYSMMVSAAGSTKPYLLYQQQPFEGGVRSLQAIIRTPNGAPITRSIAYPAWNAGTGPVITGVWTSVEPLGDSGWYLCKAEGFTQDGSNDLVGVYVTPGNTIFVDTMFLENRVRSTPITHVTRPDKTLKYSLHRDWNLDWSKDWTIAFWKKPVVAQTGIDLNGYSIDSLGSSEAKGYQWFGKYTMEDVTFRPPSVIDKLKFFGSWHMVAIRRIGDIITFFRFDADGKVYRDEWTPEIKDADYFSTNKEYDLVLGGWINAAGENINGSYYRDLVVLKRALSDNDIHKLYKTNISLKGGKMLVQNEIEEI